MKLTVRDTAKMLNVAEGDVYRWIREKSIPVHRVNDHYRFHRAEVLEWATSRGMRVSSEEFHREAHAGTSADESNSNSSSSSSNNKEDDGDAALSLAQPHLSDALAIGGVCYDVGGTDRESVLRNVVDHLPIEEADRDLVYDFLIARESLGSTSIGDGIAIPHVRNPLVLHVAKPSITLCFLEKPVAFGAMDGRPVHTLFSLVSPTIRSHLFLLSRIAAALHDERFKAALARRASKEEILAEVRRLEQEQQQQQQKQQQRPPIPST